MDSLGCFELASTYVLLSRAHPMAVYLDSLSKQKRIRRRVSSGGTLQQRPSATHLEPPHSGSSHEYVITTTIELQLLTMS